MNGILRMETTAERYERWKNHPNTDDETRAELAALTDPEEINDRFFRELSFGTGGMRGVMGAGTNRLNRYVVRRVASGLAEYLLDKAGAEACSVVIAYDTRHRSRAFADETAETLLGRGVDVMLYETPVPTPMLSFSVPFEKAAAGVMITASHNPPEYNGIKVYDEYGVQLTPPKANALTAYIGRQPDALAIEKLPPKGEKTMLGQKELDAYLDAVQRQALPADGKDALAVVYTPIHGAGLAALTGILNRDGFANVSLVTEQTTPDGAFPTVKSPNPEERGALAMGIALAEETNADLILGTDPDSDRLGVGVRHNGEYRLLTGNQIGALLVWFVLEKHKNELTSAHTIVKTIVTGELGAKIAESYGVRTMDTLTGFKYIGEASVAFEAGRERIFLMGYEESYGCLVGTHARDKDAAVAAMLTAELAADAKSRNRTLIDVLDELYARYGYYADALETVLLPGERGMREIAETMERFRAAGAGVMPEACELLDYQNGICGLPKENVLRFVFADGSWTAVRPSGTEPKIKLYFSICGAGEAAANARLNEIRKAALGFMRARPEETK